MQYGVTNLGKIQFPVRVHAVDFGLQASYLVVGFGLTVITCASTTPACLAEGGSGDNGSAATEDHIILEGSGGYELLLERL